VAEGGKRSTKVGGAGAGARDNVQCMKEVWTKEKYERPCSSENETERQNVQCRMM
jgi:hypothetical protein